MIMTPDRWADRVLEEKARAEKAEAEIARLRAALERIATEARYLGEAINFAHAALRAGHCGDFPVGHGCPQCEGER